MDDSEKDNIDQHALHTNHHHHPTYDGGTGGVLPDGNLHGIQQQHQQQQHQIMDAMMKQYQDPPRQLIHENYNNYDGNQKLQQYYDVSSSPKQQQPQPPHHHQEDLTSDITLSIHQYRDREDDPTKKKIWNKQRLNILQISGTFTYYPSKPQRKKFHMTVADNDTSLSTIQMCVQSLYATRQKPSFVSLQLSIDTSKSIPNQKNDPSTSKSKQINDSRKDQTTYYNNQSILKYWKENLENMLYTDLDVIKYTYQDIHFQQKRMKRSWNYYHQQYSKYPIFQIFIILLFGYLQAIYLRNYWDKHKSYV